MAPFSMIFLGEFSIAIYSYAGEDGNYWSASVLETYQYNAHNFIFNSGLHKPAVDNRCFGMSVRAVTKY